MKIKFQQRRAKPKCSIDKKMKFLPIPYQFHHQNLNVGWNVFLRICNNFSKQICLSKPVFNNISRRDHSSLINNTIISKIKYFPQLLALGPQIALKRRWHYFLFINHYHQTRYVQYTRHVYKYKCDYIGKGLL